MFRVTAYYAALILVPFLGMSLNATAAPACDDAGCQTATESKPLDIMKFMREQAASTRTAKPRPRQSKVQPAAHVQRPARRAVAARPKPAPAELPVEAAASYASQQQAVQVVASDEFNDIDRAAAATATSTETTGAAIAAEPNVQLVEADALNDIDRKAEDRLPPLSAAARVADAHASAGQASGSWLQWIWSAVGNIFAALATAVHQLVGL